VWNAERPDALAQLLAALGEEAEAE
jgi:hypothetical protein